MSNNGIFCRLVTVAACVLSAFIGGSTAREAAAAPQSRDAAGAAIGQPELSGTKRALILCGLPGDKAHRKAFAETVEKLRETLIARYGFKGSEVHIQFAGPIAEGEGPVLSGVRGQATREEIESEA